MLTLKKVFLTVFLVGVMINAKSQDSNKSLLIGSWQFKGSSINNEYLPIPDSIVIINTYFDNLLFQTLDSNLNEFKNQSIYHEGKWRIKKNGVLIRIGNGRCLNCIIPKIEIDGISEHYGKSKQTDKSSILMINDTSMILSFENGFTQWYYKKIKNIPYYVAAKKENKVRNDSIFILVNTMDSLKTVRLKGSYYLQFNDTGKDTLIKDYHLNLNGNFNKINKTQIGFVLKEETIETSFKNGLSIYSSKDYDNYDGSGSEDQRMIDKKVLEQLRYTSPGRTAMSKIGGATLTASLLTALLIAPLASVNYKDGVVNKDKYTRIALSGLTGVAVSVPFLIFGRSKAYKLTEKGSRQDKDYWYIAEEKKQ
jgi:hypothetical protein